jgi:polysaccharide biosynthesis/export protein
MRKGDILYVPNSAGANIRQALDPFRAAQQQSAASAPE